MGQTTYQIGTAKIEITPDFPVRLSGYGVRRAESEGVAGRIWAKALGISDDERAAVLLTVENCVVPDVMTEAVAGRLQDKAGIPRERFVVSSSHSHAAPCLTNVVPTLFGEPIPDEHQAKIDRYTRELTDKMEEVTLAALADLQPGNLAWGQGQVGFAQNRRTPGGPVDHALPMLCASGADGEPLAIVTTYTCHCTTLGGNFNKICGDWVGYAQGYIETDYPGAIGMVTIGCAGDANPEPRTGLRFARGHGHAIAAEVNRLLGGNLTPIRDKLTGRVKRVELPFDRLPTRQEWEDRAKQGGAIGYHAQVSTWTKLNLYFSPQLFGPQAVTSVV